VLAAPQRFEDQRPGRFQSPDQLDHDMEVGVAQDLGRIGRADAGRQAEAARASKILIADVPQDHPRAGAALQQPPFFQEGSRHPGPNGAKAD
jgi:hypothetical protein